MLEFIVAQLPVVHLYSTLGCHLCEHAKAMVLPVCEEFFLHLEEKEIADCESLLERYGTSIPVLYFPDTQRSLYWPFDQHQLRVFLQRQIGG